MLMGFVCQTVAHRDVRADRMDAGSSDIQNPSVACVAVAQI